MGTHLGVYPLARVATLALFTGVEWVIIIVCLIIILGVLAWLIGKYGPWSAGGAGGAGGGASIPMPPGAAEMLELQRMFQQAQDGGWDDDNCARARQLIRDARAAGVPSDDMDRLEGEVDKLCD